MAKLTTEELLENEDLVDALFKYGNRQNKNYITREDALEDFLGEYRGVQANTAFAVAFANDIDNIRSDEDRLQFGRLYKAVDEDLEDFAGRQSALATTGEYILKGILDPLNIFGFGVGKAVSQTIGRQALKRLIANSFAKTNTQPIKKNVLNQAKQHVSNAKRIAEEYALPIGSAAFVGAGEGAIQGALLENLKDRENLGYQDEMNLGNIATMAGAGAGLGGILGGVGAALGRRGVKKVEGLLQEQQIAEEAAKLKLPQNRVSQAKTVQSHIENLKEAGEFKINPATGTKYSEDDVLGTYVRSTTGDDIIENAANYGQFPRIFDISYTSGEKGLQPSAVLEFIPTTYAKKINPATGKYDERIEISVPLDKIKAVSQKDADAYKNQYVAEYGLFFDKAGIEKGKQFLLENGESAGEVDSIFNTVLNKETFDDLTRFVFDAGQNMIAESGPNSKIARQIEMILDDPAKRITEKVGQLLRLGQQNEAFLSRNINDALTRNGLSVEDAVNMMKADASMAAAKIAEVSNLNQILNPSSSIGRKLKQMEATMTVAQRNTLAAVAKQREMEKLVAKKFGVAVDIWRSFLVTQPATTMRNIFGSVLRVPGESANTFLASSKFMLEWEAKALGIKAPDLNLKNEADLLAKSLLNPNESIQIAQLVANKFPEADRQLFKMFDDYFATAVSDQTGAGGVIKTLHSMSKYANVLNRAQDRAIKSAGFVSELDSQIKQAVRTGDIDSNLNITSLEDIIKNNRYDLINDEMVSKSLQTAYRLTYQNRRAGDDLFAGREAINNLQSFLNRAAIVKIGIPFPNFIINGMVYTFNRGLGGGILKAMRARANIDTFTKGKGKDLVVKERERINELTKQIKELPKKMNKKDQAFEYKRLADELNELEAKAGSRLRDIEDYRKGMVESVEGLALIGVGYTLRENFGGARYDELRVGDQVVNVGPLFPLTPFLFIGEAIRKIMNNEPLDELFVVEGIEALSGFQADRAGPIAKAIGGLERYLTTLTNAYDPQSYAKLGQIFGELAGYWAKGYLTPLKVVDDTFKTFGPKELRQSYDREFQNLIPSDDTDSLSMTAIKETFNEFGRQMFRGTSFQGILNQKAPRSGRALPEVSSTTEEPKIQRGQLIPKQFLGASTKRFQQVEQELNRLGIKPYKLERRTTVPEYNRLYKALLGVMAEKTVKNYINQDFYKQMPIEDQQRFIRDLYFGDLKDMPPEIRDSMTAVFGKQSPNIRTYVASAIAQNKPYLNKLALFKSRNSKAELNKVYKDFGNLVTLNYYGEDNADNPRQQLANAVFKEDGLLDLMQEHINNPTYRTSMLLNQTMIDLGINEEIQSQLSQTGGEEGGKFAKGGYVSQMNALGFSEGGNVGMKGMSVLGKTADLNNPMTEAQRETGARLRTSGSPLTRALGPGVDYLLEALSEVAKGDTSKGAELAATKRLTPFSSRKEKLDENVELKIEDVLSSYIGRDNPKTAKQVQSELKEVKSIQAPEGYKANLRKKDSDGAFEVENIRTGSVHEIFREPSRKSYATTTANEIEKVLLDNKTKLISAKDTIPYEAGEKDFVNYASEAANRQKIIPDIFPSKTVKPTKYTDDTIATIISNYKPSTVKGLMGRTDSLTNEIPEGKLVAVRPNLNSHINDENVPIPTLKPRNKQPLLSVQEEGKLQGKVFADRPYVLVTPEKKEGIVSFVVDQEIRAVIAGGGAKDRMMAVRGEYTDYSKDKFSIDEPRTVEIKFNPREHHLAVRADTNEGVVGSRGPVLTIADRIYAKVTDLVYSRNRDAPKPLGSKIVKDKKGKEKRVADKEATPHESTVRHRYRKGGLMMGRI